MYGMYNPIEITCYFTIYNWYFRLLKIAIEIVDLPNKTNGDFPVRYWTVYQRVFIHDIRRGAAAAPPALVCQVSAPAAGQGFCS